MPVDASINDAVCIVPEVSMFVETEYRFMRLDWFVTNALMSAFCIFVIVSVLPHSGIFSLKFN